MEKKVLYVDYVKGLAIILMVLLHSSRWIESGYVSSMPTMSFEKIIPYTISALLASASLF